LDIYDEMNDLVMGILSLKNRSGKKTLSHREEKLFYMACYDSDRFRDFAFEHRLWQTSPVEHTVENIREDDVALMKFAIEWIKQELWGRE
jgi:hypothetical protein